MSKMDGLRAMREARYAEAAARASRPDVPRPAAASTPGPTPETEPETGEARRPVTAPPSGAAGREPALCGHRAISGRTCTREAGHAARSHRYA
jgi:hypothetical protein